MIGGYPSLTKPSSPKEAIVRLVLKATVAHVEAKKPAGRWEKLAGESYAKIMADPESGIPSGQPGGDPRLSHADAGEPRPPGVRELES